MLQTLINKGQKKWSTLYRAPSGGVGASLIDLFTESSPSFSIFGFVYFFILAFVGYFANKIMLFISNKRKYEINDIEYDKDID